MGLPEQVGGERNWDYRYTWVRDGSLSVRALLDLGFVEEATRFAHWLGDRLRDREGPDGEPLQIMYRVDGDPHLTEEILDHFEGYRGSYPVRVGNAAADQLQLDIYGEALYALAEGREVGEQAGYHGWKGLARTLDWLADSWDRPDEGIWETRGGRKDFTYSRVMCWVAFDRGLRLAEEFSRPADTARWTRRPGRHPRTGHGTRLEREGAGLRPALRRRRPGRLPAAHPPGRVLSPRSPGWLSTLDAMDRKLVSDSLVYRYDPAASPDGLRGSEGTFSLCTFLYVDALARAGRLPRPATPSRRCRPTPTMSACSPRRSARAASNWATSPRRSPICPSSWPRHDPGRGARPAAVRAERGGIARAPAAATRSSRTPRRRRARSRESSPSCPRTRTTSTMLLTGSRRALVARGRHARRPCPVRRRAPAGARAAHPSHRPGTARGRRDRRAGCPGRGRSASP